MIPIGEFLLSFEVQKIILPKIIETTYSATHITGKWSDFIFPPNIKTFSGCRHMRCVYD
jgi:hypothetical protein